MASSEEIALLREIRDLLLVIAEPRLAERQAAMQANVLLLIGKSEKRRKALSLMDGTRSRKEIGDGVGFDAGNISRLISELRNLRAIQEDEGKPRLLCDLTPDVNE